MGIQGLLPFLKDATQQVNIRKYSGFTVAVDTYCWIHRGAFGCAPQLAKGEQTDMYVRYCLKFINMLRAMDIKPILVFDGSRLPAKKAVEESRRERRELYSKKGKQFLREGKVSEARDCFTKCVNVTAHMALQVIKAATSLGVDCIVAPYEADAQLAFLAHRGIAQAVITEDSDLVAFGCPRIIYKLDLNGNGLEIAASRLNLSMKTGDRFSMDKFRYMCIASGCDYLASLPGIGLGKARKLFQTATNPDLNHVLKRMPIHLKMKLTVPPEYITSFHQANNTFLYQLAFDPIRRRLVPLHPYSNDVDKDTLSYAGSYYSSDLALQQALGNVDPNTKKIIWDFQPQTNKPYDKSVGRHTLSIWHKHYRPRQEDVMEENRTEIPRHTTQGKEVVLMVNALKKESQCRKRPRPDADEETPTNDDLTSIYGSPNAKRRPSTGQTLAIPETPESKEKETTKISPRPRNPFSKETGQDPKPQFGGEERIAKTLSRRNIFAVGRTSGNSRLDILNGNTIVTSRFFSNKPSPEPQDIDSLQMECSPPNQSCEDETCNSQSSVSLMNEQDMTPNTDNSGNQEVAQVQRQVSAKSSLNMLQRFQRNNSAPTLPSTRSQSSKPLSSAGSAKECALGAEDTEMNSDCEVLSSQESLCSSIKSESSGTTRRRTGAFCWSGTSNSVTNLKKEQCPRKFRSLSDFRKVTKTTRLERDASHSQKQSSLGSSQGDSSQASFSVSLNVQSQESPSSSMDTDSLDLSRLNGQHFAEDNSQAEESLTLYVENEMNSSEIASHREGLSSPSSESELSTGSQHQSVDQNSQRLQAKHSEASECIDFLSADGTGSSQDHAGRPGRVSGTTSTLQRGGDLIDCGSTNDENASPTSDVKIRDRLTKKEKKVPSLPTLPKLDLGGVGSKKLGQCKAPGLSRSQKTKRTAKTDENRLNGTKQQQTLFAFMKKNSGRQDVTKPLSPSKQNVTNDVTPEGANSMYNKGIIGVQRKIFK